jgi:hypothetical protein
MGKALALPDEQAPEGEADLFVDALGPTDLDAEGALPPSAKEMGAESDAQLSFSLPWFSPEQPALTDATLKDPSTQPPATEAAAPHGTPPFDWADLRPEIGGRNALSQEFADVVSLLPPDADVTAGQNLGSASQISHGVQDDTQRRADETPALPDGALTDSAPAPSSAANPEGLSKAGTPPAMTHEVAAALRADAPDGRTANPDPTVLLHPKQGAAGSTLHLPAVESGQITAPVPRTVVTLVRIERPLPPYPTGPAPNVAADQTKDNAPNPIRLRYPSVQEHSLRLTAALPLGIDGQHATLPPAALTPGIATDAAPGNAHPSGASPLPLADATSKEQAPALPTPPAEAIGKINPMVSDDPSRPNDLAIASQSGASTLAPGAAPTGQIGTTASAPAQSPMQQASAALVRLATDTPGRIELTLTPETLGRVHFDMRPEGTGLAITVSAERSETLDLIRRHLPDLLAELRQAGVQAGTMSFGSWTEGQSAPSKDGWTKNPDKDPAPTLLASPTPLDRPTPAATGLNLRL